MSEPPLGGGGRSGDVEDELRFHIEERIDALLASGLTESEARRRVLEAFGDVARIRDECRRIDEQRMRRERRRAMLGGLWWDVRLAVRRLARSPGYVAVAVATLALGIGAAVGIFSVVNAVVLRPLPYPAPDRLVHVWPAQNFNIALSREVTAESPSLASATGVAQWGLTLTGEGPAAVLQAEVVDPGYFAVFGVRPALGRSFLGEDGIPSESDVVLLSDELWRGRFGADPAVIGRRVELEGYTHESREVVGVMPRGFRPFGRDIDVWIPLHLRPGTGVAQDSSWYVNNVVGRLAEGATLAAADAEVRTIAHRLHGEHPGLFREGNVAAAGALNLLDSVVRDVRGGLWLLLSAVGLVLLIACANLANLQLARAEGMRRDVAVRAALGASRGRLIRYHLVEGLLLALTGGAMGVLLAHGLLGLLGVGDAGLPRGDIGIDSPVLAFALAVSVGAVLVFGLLPALRATAGDLHATLSAGGRGHTGSRGTHRLNRVLVGAEIALAVVLITGAGLMLDSFVTLRSVDPGLDPDDVLAVALLPGAEEYQGERLRAFYDEVEARLAALPGIEQIGGIHLMPFTQNNWAFPYLAEGQVPRADEPLPAANFRVVSPGYFDAVDIPILAGRDVTRGESPGDRVVLINRTLAEELWPGEDPLDRTIRIFGTMEHRVVGVVDDVHQHELGREPRPEMYVSATQWERVTQRVLMLEGPGAGPELAGAVRNAIQEIDPDVPITRVEPLEAVLGESVARERFFAGVLAFFGGLALLLGAVGVYGVMGTMVGARLPDFGVRMAFGARPGAVVGEALRAGLMPVVIGLGVGLAAAPAAATLLRGLLFGVQAFEPATYVAVALVLGATAALAAWLPARRAARLDPVEVLRAE